MKTQAEKFMQSRKLAEQCYGPYFSMDELRLLARGTYEEPLIILPRERRLRRLARQFVVIGLFETDGGSRFRRTELGNLTLAVWRKAGFLA